MSLEPSLRRFADAFVAPFRDPRWVQKIAAQGAFLLVPLAGWIALLGWQRKSFEMRRSGDTALPDAAFASHFRGGLRVAFALTLLVAPCFALLAASDAVRHWRGPTWLRILLDPDLFPFFGLPWLYLGYAEALRRAFGAGSVVGLLNPLPTLVAIRTRPIGFLLAAGCMVAAWIVTSAGISVCLIGIVVSAPIGHAIAAGVAAAWQSDLDAAE